MSKKVLFVAFHFPPFAGSSGVQRTLRFSKYLPENGWDPIILTAKKTAYEICSNDLIDKVSKDLIIKRSFALDTARHLAIKGRYFQLLAVPDRWISWAISAIPIGYMLIKKYKPSALWSTYPLASTHIIAWVLSKFTGIPWIADFRDPMVEYNSKTKNWVPYNKNIRNSRLWIEQKAVNNAAHLVFCTEGAREICKNRYPHARHDTWHVIPNGYDNEIFEDVENDLQLGVNTERAVTLLHSGVLYYSDDRNPEFFFEAISKLKSKGIISNNTLKIILRACGNDNIYTKMIEEKGIDDIVEIAPPIPYSDAIKEMLTVDGLLVMQGYTSNPAIPAKVYEYLRAKKPIFGLLDSEGETAKLLSSLGMNYCAPLDNSQEIEINLPIFINDINNKKIIPVNDNIISKYSRKNQAIALSKLLDSIII